MDYLVGTAAVEAEPYNPAATIRCVKRALGTSKSYNINGCSVDTELATSLILRSLRRNAEEALGTRYPGVSPRIRLTVRDILLLNALQFGLGFHILWHGKTMAIDTKRWEADENVITVLSPSTTIPTKRSEILPSLEPGESYEIELVEIPLSSKLVFGRIPFIRDTSETELTVDVDNGSNVVIAIKDLGSGKLSRYALDQLS
jgi:hypothetical protein